MGAVGRIQQKAEKGLGNSGVEGLWDVAMEMGQVSAAAEEALPYLDERNRKPDISRDTFRRLMHLKHHANTVPEHVYEVEIREVRRQIIREKAQHIQERLEEQRRWGYEWTMIKCGAKHSS